MADDDDTIGVDHNWLAKTKFVDGLDDGGNRIVIDSRILFVRLDPIKRPHFDLHMHWPFQGEERNGRVRSMVGCLDSCLGGLVVVS